MSSGHLLSGREVLPREGVDMKPICRSASSALRLRRPCARHTSVMRPVDPPQNINPKEACAASGFSH